jgi:hypothetical protein
MHIVCDSSDHSLGKTKQHSHETIKNKNLSMSNLMKAQHNISG